MTRRATLIEKRKWDGTVSARWTAVLWREGDRILWWTPLGTVRDEPRKGGTERVGRHELSASCGRGWIVHAILTGEGALVRYEVDATAGGEEVVDGCFSFIDLDLDLEIREGSLEVQDLIEFAERGRTMGYPPHTLSAAIAALEEARELHRTRSWPFDGALLSLPQG